MAREKVKKYQEYPEDTNNLFYEYKNHATLNDGYHSYVRKHGTNEYINAQYVARVKELDIIDWLKSI